MTGPKGKYRKKTVAISVWENTAKGSGEKYMNFTLEKGIPPKEEGGEWRNYKLTLFESEAKDMLEMLQQALAEHGEANAE